MCTQYEQQVIWVNLNNQPGDNQPKKVRSCNVGHPGQASLPLEWLPARTCSIKPTEPFALQQNWPAYTHVSLSTTTHLC